MVYRSCSPCPAWDVQTFFESGESLEVVQVVQLLTMHLAPDDILVNTELILKEGLTTTQVEKVIDRIEEEIRKEVPEARRIFIECETLKIARENLQPEISAPVKG